MKQQHFISKIHEREWKKGIFHNSEYQPLWKEQDTKSKTEAFIVKLNPGGFIPVHNHPGREYAYVLEGSMLAGGEPMEEGDFLTAGPDELHDIQTDTGVIFFLVIEEPIEIVE
ncbi:hypothetical protein ABD76_18385 [Paenibacillus dendritiformis]|uniref:cupin domain-containing protein n=1 Tax=Paenibacillus dendritiformis TaxID=130049 RepID=UPI0018CD60DF|nr:cupin domain-containing protein [Paenibacillus dendritiformis]MBG9794368.1 hypothetical protein [Paenibacillus dendritiformis]